MTPIAPNATLTLMTTSYFVTLAPGHYGDSTRVISSHRTLAAARRAAFCNYGVQFVVRAGSKRRGDLFLRAYEETYPIAPRASSREPREDMHF